jgi:protein O-GlcNAc transferase
LHSRKRRAPAWLPQSKPAVNNFAARVNARFQEGVVHQNAGRYGEAQKIYEKIAVDLERAGVEDASIYAALGYTHLLQNEMDESLEFSLKSLSIDPKFVKALINASAACRCRNNLDAALEFIERARALEPENPQVLGALGMVLINQGKTSSALIHASHAFSLDSECVDAMGALALCYARIGEMDMSHMLFQRALDRLPHDAALLSAWLFNMHYKPDITREELVAAHREWGTRFADRFKKDWPVHKNERTTARRLRIGYLSGDFRSHVVGFWTRHIIRDHDRDRFEVFCFVNNKEDDFSRKIKEGADHWIPVLGESDADVARLIEEARIDILVDLSGHTGGHRLLVMARKPAPVQATWCGYIDSTGLDAVDYVICDEAIAPASEPSPFVEQPMRLPNGAVCFNAIPEAPEVGPLPCLEKGYVTFGCFNNPSKVGPEVADLWVKILNSVEGSRLLLTYNNLTDGFTRERLLKLFRDRNVDPARIRIGCGNRAAALQAYSSEVDIALDTFPYTGGTTTCEALWMGVPVVSLYGSHALSRFGGSLLVYSGLPGLAATTHDEYVEAAVRLASDIPTLAALRSGMRGHLVKTPLFNSKLFLADLEAAYIAAFETWCRS